MTDEFHKKLVAKIEEARRTDPGERFDRMVEHGLINRQGQLTRSHGGTAEPIATTSPQFYDPIETEKERLKWREVAGAMSFGYLDGSPHLTVSVSPWGVVVLVERDGLDPEADEPVDLAVTYPVPKFTTREAAAEYFVKLVEGNACHEVREHARLDGKRIFDPHPALKDRVKSRCPGGCAVGLVGHSFDVKCGRYCTRGKMLEHVWALTQCERCGVGRTAAITPECKG